MTLRTQDRDCPVPDRTETRIPKGWWGVMAGGVTVAGAGTVIGGVTLAGVGTVAEEMAQGSDY